MSDKKFDLTIVEKPVTNFEETRREALSNITVSHRSTSQDFDGKTCFFDIIDIPLQDQKGSIVGSLSLSHDITEYKKTEATLRESEEYFRKAFEGAPLAMVMMNIDFRIIRANDAFCGMVGYPEKELTSCPLTDITDPNNVTGDELLINDLLIGKIPFYRTEKRYIKRDREIIWGSSTTNIISDKDNRFLYFLAIIEDITEIKKAQEDTKAHLDPSYIQTQKMESVETLAGGIAHEFNNILTTIIGFSSLLQIKMDNLDPRQIYVEKIVSASKRAEQLTKSLLAFSRKQHIDLRPLKVNHIVNDLGTLIRQILTRNIELEITLTAENPSIMADVVQIDQILINFTNNAREAMPNGGVLSIETQLATLDDEFIRTHGYGEQGTYVVISVSDTGTGMDQQTKERIFEPFFTTKGLGKGTGLGLSSAYGTVKQHNGYITVSSELGYGSTFCVYFPLFDTVKKDPISAKDVPHLLLINEEKAEVTASDKNVKKGGGTIIIAEDDPWVRELIADILEVEGYKTLGASDGEEAIRIFSEFKEQVVLIIIDVGMPKKNGIEVFEAIRKIRPDITALFTSGIADDLILSREIQSGTFEFISKPLSHDELLIKVNKILGN